jgi:hypothetical protein
VPSHAMVAHSGIPGIASSLFAPRNDMSVSVIARHNVPWRTRTMRWLRIREFPH